MITLLFTLIGGFILLLAAKAVGDKLIKWTEEAEDLIENNY